MAKSKAELEHWMVDWFTKELGKNYPKKVTPDLTFFDSGIDSLTAVEFVMALSDEVGQEIEVETALEHPSIQELAAYYSKEDEA